MEARPRLRATIKTMNPESQALVLTELSRSDPVATNRKLVVPGESPPPPRTQKRPKIPSARRVHTKLAQQKKKKTIEKNQFACQEISISRTSPAFFYATAEEQAGRPAATVTIQVHFLSFRYTAHTKLSPFPPKIRPRSLWK